MCECKLLQNINKLIEVIKSDSYMAGANSKEFRANANYWMQQVAIGKALLLGTVNMAIDYTVKRSNDATS